MFKVKEYSGSYEVVLLNMLEVTSKYPLLIESAAEVTCNVIGSTTRSKYTEYVWLGHTDYRGLFNALHFWCLFWCF